MQCYISLNLITKYIDSLFNTVGCPIWVLVISTHQSQSEHGTKGVTSNV